MTRASDLPKRHVVKLGTEQIQCNYHKYLFLVLAKELDVLDLGHFWCIEPLLHLRSWEKNPLELRNPFGIQDLKSCAPSYCWMSLVVHMGFAPICIWTCQEFVSHPIVYNLSHTKLNTLWCWSVKVKQKCPQRTAEVKFCYHILGLLPPFSPPANLLYNLI